LVVYRFDFFEVVVVNSSIDDSNAVVAGADEVEVYSDFDFRDVYRVDLVVYDGVDEVFCSEQSEFFG
jgi:hypothetical protein